MNINSVLGIMVDIENTETHMVTDPISTLTFFLEEL